MKEIKDVKEKSVQEWRSAKVEQHQRRRTFREGREINEVKEVKEVEVVIGPLDLHCHP